MVLATQNPVEHHGTYPLPESQLDRFLMKIEIGYPNAVAEKEILKRFTNGHRTEVIRPVLGPDDVRYLQDESRKIHIEEKIVDYIVQLVHRTRSHADVELGISPRGSLALFRTAQSLALVEGRGFVTPDDVKRLVPPVFGHRLVIARAGGRARSDARTILQAILDETAVP